MHKFNEIQNTANMQCKSLLKYHKFQQRNIHWTFIAYLYIFHQKKNYNCAQF